MTGVERVELAAAYVLHRRAYRDTSALVELFTADYGRVGVVARGVRGRRSGQAAILQPFQPLRVSWQARGELGTLTGVEAVSGPRALVGQRLVAGFYTNELMMRLLGRQQPQALTFGRYATVLEELAIGAPIGPSLRLFERDLLNDLGYGLRLSADTAGTPVEPAQWYRYDLEDGPVPVAHAEAVVGLRLSGESLLALAQGRPQPAHDAELKRLMRAALRLYLGDKPLKSRELYARYRSQGQTNGDDMDHD
jgi:DNA repair protein RecO (recombination protein O)